MIFYGTKPIHVKSENAPIIKCTSCDSQGGISFHFYSTHAHLYWIPIFPYSRIGYSSCQNCGAKLEPKQMSESMKRSYDIFRKGARTPIWQFSGLALIAILILFGIYTSKANDARELEYMASPRVEDIYRYKIAYNEYSTLKIAEITADTIYVVPNEYITNKMSGVSSIDKEKNYGDLMYGISRDEIQRMYDTNEIYEIDRN